MKPKAIMNWSGGKDSALALQAVWQADELAVVGLLTTINEAYGRVSMHGVREELVEQQAQELGLPLTKVYLPERVPMEIYDTLMHQHLAQMTAVGVTHAIFGDIFLQDLRRYREERLASAGMTAVFPLWNVPSAELMQRFFNDGFRACTVCTNHKVLDERFVGRELDEAFVASLPEGVDVCGENGEYHSFVYAGPIFARPIPCRRGAVVRRTIGEANAQFDNIFWFADLLPA